jgi:DNA (cytosine-5)-methyltransferase 1
MDGESETLIAFDTTQITSKENRCQPRAGAPCHPLAAGAHAPAIAFSSKDYGGDAGQLAPTLRAGGHKGSHANAGVPPAIAFHARQDPDSGEVTHALDTGIQQEWAVRRITPTEAERLQGFPDGWTLVPFRGKPAKDGPRYKAIGNSMATTVMRAIGEGIDAVERRRQQEAAFGRQQ